MQLSGARRDRVAVLAAIVVPLGVTAALVPLRTSFNHTDAALLLVAVVVAVAANGNRAAGYLAAVSSAVWFDFFLTPPYQHFTMNRPSDVQKTLLLLVIGIAVTELAGWGRRGNAAASKRAGYLNGIYATAEATVTATAPSAVTAQVSQQLTQLLELKSCRFQVGVAGLGVSARLRHDGGLTVDGADWPAESRGLPHLQIELLVQTGSYLQGRFLMQPQDGAKPPLENRLVAAALSDQVGVALADQSLHRTHADQR
jgi:K+-sensing histidine kinase KdpD